LSEITNKTYRIKFEKTGVAKYISHLDLNRLFSRSFARAGVEIAHSEGFNPHPKIVFASAISLGIESFCEFVDVKIIVGHDAPGVPEISQDIFPQGINIREVYEPSNEFKNIDRTKFELFLNPDGFSGEDLEKLFQSDVFVEKKPGVIINLKDYIESFSVSSETENEYIKITVTVKTNQEMFLNPENIIKAIKSKYPLDDYFIRKIEIYDKNNEVFK